MHKNFLLKYDIFFISLVLFLGIILVNSNTYAGNKFSPIIRVGLWENQTNVVLSAPYGLSVINSLNNDVIIKLKNNEILNVSYTEKGFKANNLKVDSDSVVVVPNSVKEENGWVKVNKKKYRGKIELKHNDKGKKGFAVIDVLPLEEYLYSVVPSEISPSWSFEALRAQAVAARTFALSSMNKNPGKMYDIGTTTNDQVYAGKDAENDLTTKAVDSTVGMAVLYNNELITAYFFSCSGGYTENIENVWGSKIPYLLGVQDYDQKSPHYQWEKSYKASEIEAKLKQAGYNIGKLKTIVLSPLKVPPTNVSDRGVSGRIKSIHFSGTQGSATLTGNKLRSLFNLPSTLIDITVATPTPDSVPLDMSDKYGSSGIYEMQVNVPKENAKNVNIGKNANTIYITESNREVILFKGKGWGHGIGMSQWGAKAMAEAAPKGEKDFYIKILKHYYTGVEIKKVY